MPKGKVVEKSVKGKKSKATLRYFEVHVRFSRKEGSSYFFGSSNLTEVSEEQIIKAAVKLKEIDSDDALFVDYAKEITESEYKKAKNLKG